MFNYYYSKCPIHLSFHSFIQTSCDIFFTYFQNINTKNNGGAISFSNELSNFYCSHSFFLKTHCISGQYEAGGIYIDKSQNVTARCSLFYENFAYYSNSFFITFRNNPDKKFPLIINSICETNAYPIENCNSRLDIIGGNPLGFKHSNISNIECKGCGFFVDYCENEKLGVISYINFIDLIIESYYKFDRDILTESLYFDHINMKNISAIDFFRSGTLDKNPFYFCNIIAEHEINCNTKATFINCFISPSLKGNINIFDSQHEEIVVKIITRTCKIQQKSPFFIFNFLHNKSLTIGATFFIICFLL